MTPKLKHLVRNKIVIYYNTWDKYSIFLTYCIFFQFLRINEDEKLQPHLRDDNKSKIKGKVFLCLIKHHTMKTCGWVKF
jgi:hypothetical protein